MPQLVRKRFYRTSKFTVPAGVRRLRVLARNPIEEKFAQMGSHVHAIDSAGAMWSWGQNAGGQCATGTTTDIASTPLVVVGSKVWRTVHVPNFDDGSFGGQVYGIDTDGNLWGWGNNQGFMGKGLLGTGAPLTTLYSSPTLVSGSLKWTQVRGLPSGDTFGITSDGNLYHWAYPSAVAGGSPLISTPTLVSNAAAKWKKLFGTAGIGIPFAVDDNDALWSINHSGTGLAASNLINFDGAFPGPFTSSGGALGTGDSNGATTSSTPLLVVGGHKWKKLVIGGTVIDQAMGMPISPTYYGLTKTGNVRAWGFAHLGPTNSSSGVVCTGLDRSGPAVVSTPTLVVGIASTKRVKEIYASQNGSAACLSTIFALCEDGDVYAWGGNDSACTGTGVRSNFVVSTPTLVAGGHKFVKLFVGEEVSAMQAGTNRVFGLDKDGALWGWGDNASGELAVGPATPTQVSTPTLVIGGRKWQDAKLITQAWTRMVAIDNLGDIYQWGSRYGGSGGFNSTSTPTLVVGAHLIDTRKPADVVLEIDVTPGQEIPIEMGGIFSSINGQAFAKLPSEIEIQFER